MPDEFGAPIAGIAAGGGGKDQPALKLPVLGGKVRPVPASQFPPKPVTPYSRHRLSLLPAVPGVCVIYSRSRETRPAILRLTAQWHRRRNPD